MVTILEISKIVGIPKWRTLYYWRIGVITADYFLGKVPYFEEETALAQVRTKLLEMAVRHNRHKLRKEKRLKGKLKNVGPAYLA